MNTKEIISELKERLQTDSETINKLCNAFAETLGEELCNGNSLSVSGFGVFEARRKKERIFVDPTTKDRLMSPPKQVLAFKMSNVLKEKLN